MSCDYCGKKLDAGDCSAICAAQLAKAEVRQWERMLAGWFEGGQLTTSRLSTLAREAFPDDGDRARFFGWLRSRQAARKAVAQKQRAGRGR